MARQYCGQLGKTENRQVAVSLSLATVEGRVPLDYRLYLPEEWTEDKARCKRAGVPKEIAFATKGEIAWGQIEAALAAGIPRGTVLMDAAYGDEAALRDRLSAHGLIYAVGIRPATAVWCDGYEPAPAPVKHGRGRRRTCVLRDETHQPIGVRELAQGLPSGSYRTVTWREGTNAALSSRFARVRVRAAHADRPREEEWLMAQSGAVSELFAAGLAWVAPGPAATASALSVATLRARIQNVGQTAELKATLTPPAGSTVLFTAPAAVPDGNGHPVWSFSLDAGAS
ncbi:MAG: transposase, partial [Betaproteobacteria bacterium]|nr:transposase [Betaproteobacteria bacterium]